MMGRWPDTFVPIRLRADDAEELLQIGMDQLETPVGRWPDGEIKLPHPTVRCRNTRAILRMSISRCCNAPCVPIMMEWRMIAW